MAYSRCQSENLGSLFHLLTDLCSLLRRLNYKCILVSCSLGKCIKVAFSVDISVLKKNQISDKKVNQKPRQETESQLKSHLCSLKTVLGCWYVPSVLNLL